MSLTLKGGTTSVDLTTLRAHILAAHLTGADRLFVATTLAPLFRLAATLPGVH